MFFFAFSLIVADPQCYMDEKQSGLRFPITSVFRSHISYHNQYTNNKNQNANNQHSNTQHSNTQHSNTQYSNTQHSTYHTQHSNTQHSHLFQNLNIEYQSFSSLHIHTIGVVHNIFSLIYQNDIQSNAIQDITIRGDPSTNVGLLLGSANSNTMVSSLLFSFRVRVTQILYYIVYINARTQTCVCRALRFLRVLCVIRVRASISNYNCL